MGLSVLYVIAAKLLRPLGLRRRHVSWVLDPLGIGRRKVSSPFDNNIKGISARSEVLERILNSLGRQLEEFARTAGDGRSNTILAARFQPSRWVDLITAARKELDALVAQSALLRRKSAHLSLISQRAMRDGGWVTGDDLSTTTGYLRVPMPVAPYVQRRRGRIKVLFLNSMGGSMGRLSKALMIHHGVDADCVIGAYYPRRHMTYPHETNAFGIYSHEEWREYLAWAAHEYDIIQSTSFPLAPAVAESYDWLTDTLGRRHIWRETGFVHHYLLREDVLPLSCYQSDLETNRKPEPDRFACKTFECDGTHFLTDPQVVFYSSPEKGAYFKGSDLHWLPSMRDPDEFRPAADGASGGRAKIYVPQHRSAVFKGLGHVVAILTELASDGAPIEVITPDNAAAFFPDLAVFQAAEPGPGERVAYPIPHQLMPEVFRRVDAVVDQIIMGSYGNTGIEAMMSAKPVIGQKRYPELADAPVWHVERDDFRDRFVEFLARREEWEQIGRAGREFALRTHSPEAVSRIAAETYRRVLDEQRV